MTLTGYARGGGPGNSLNINTGKGTIDIGAQNSSWAHIYTDRPYFIFNRGIFSAPGIFSSHGTANLYLRTNGTNRMTILNSNGFVGINSTNPTRNLLIYDNVRPAMMLENPLARFELAIARNNGDGAPNSIAGDALVVLGNTSATQSYHGLIFNMNDDNNDGNSYIKFSDWANHEVMAIYNNEIV